MSSFRAREESAYAGDFLDASHSNSSYYLLYHPIDPSCLTTKERQCSIGWMFETAHEFRLRVETPQLAAFYFDRYVTVHHKELPGAPNSKERMKRIQRLVCACLHIACKLEEMYPPLMRDWCWIGDEVASESSIMDDEVEIMKTLNYRLTPSTIAVFIDYYSWRLGFDRTTTALAQYHGKWALMYPETQCEHPDDVASSCIIFVTGNDRYRMIPWLRKIFEEGNKPARFVEELPSRQPPLFIPPSPNLSPIKNREPSQILLSASSSSSSPSISTTTLECDEMV